MRHRTTKIFLAVCFLAASAFTNHFPLYIGNAWEFSYTSYSAMITYPPVYSTDSGTVTWEITDIGNLTGLPGDPEMVVTIAHTRSLVRRWGHTFQDEDYDSLFDPPRVTDETLRLTYAAFTNGISFEGDSVWSFVQDPEGEIPDSMLDLRDTSVLYGGEELSACVIDPLPGRAKGFPIISLPYDPSAFIAPSYFTTADNIGPVGRYQANPLMMEGGTWREIWTLVSASLYNSPVLPGDINKNRELSLRLLENRNSIGIVFSLKRCSDVLIRIFGLDGSLIETVAEGRRQPGVHAAEWNTKGIPAGSYIVTLRSGAASSARLVSFIK